MRKGKSVQHSVQGVFVFVLLGLFALMATLVVLLGAQMYRGIVDMSTNNANERILTSYVRSMVRAGDARGRVSIGQFGGGNAVSISEDIGGEEYVTWIYAHNGQLFEQFSSAQEELSPDAGSAITQVTHFDASLVGNLLSVRLEDQSGTHEVRVALHGQM